MSADDDAQPLLVEVCFFDVTDHECSIVIPNIAADSVDWAIQYARALLPRIVRRPANYRVRFARAVSVTHV